MRTNKNERQFPVLLAFERNEFGSLSVWCPYCADWHHHGRGDGHRIAHCSNLDSPFKKTGYIIKKGSKQDYRISENQL